MASKYSLAQNYRNAFRYLRDSRSYIMGVFLLFLLSGVVGFAFPHFFSFFDPLLRDLGSKIEGLSWWQIVLFIFQNNVTSAFFGLFLGIGLGLMPLFNAITNGAILGYVLARASAVAGISVAWRLVPHGVFELPAIFIALGLGVRLGFFFLDKRPKRAFIERLRGSLTVFLYVIIPLLVIAALIEGILISLF